MTMTSAQSRSSPTTWVGYMHSEFSWKHWASEVGILARVAVILGPQLYAAGIGAWIWSFCNPGLWSSIVFSKHIHHFFANISNSLPALLSSVSCCHFPCFMFPAGENSGCLSRTIFNYYLLDCISHVLNINSLRLVVPQSCTCMCHVFILRCHAHSAFLFILVLCVLGESGHAAKSSACRSLCAREGGRWGSIGIESQTFLSFLEISVHTTHLSFCLSWAGTENR